jgi:hypothetical protein
VKRSGRDEPYWVIIYMYIETMLIISVYSYLNLKLAKMLCLSYYLFCFLFNNIGKVGRTGSAWKQGVGGNEGGGEMAQTIYVHINK